MQKKNWCEETKAKFDALGGASYPPFQVQAGPDTSPSGPGRGPPSSTPNALISNPGRGRGRLVQWSACPPPLPDREVSTLHEKKYSFRNDLWQISLLPLQGDSPVFGLSKKKDPTTGGRFHVDTKNAQKKESKGFHLTHLELGNRGHSPRVP